MDFVDGIRWSTLLENSGISAVLSGLLLCIFGYACFFLLAVLFTHLSPNKWLPFIFSNAFIIITVFITDSNNSTGNIFGVMVLMYWFFLCVPTLLLGIFYSIRQAKKLEAEAIKEEKGEIENKEEGIE